MPGVPEINVPIAQGESTPVVQVQAPGAGAFGAGIGAGLTAIGEGLHSYGMDAYHAAVKANAQEKETEFLNESEKIRTNYRTKLNMDAISAHEATVKELSALRAKIGSSIPSKAGQSLYNDNSLRSLRYAQESVDSHFATQNKNYQIVKQKNYNFEKVKGIASAALEQPYNAKEIEDNIKELYDSNMASAKANGLDNETATQLAAHAVEPATDALFKVLLDKRRGPDPKLAKDELQKYTDLGMVSPEVQKRTQQALQGWGVISEVNKAFADTPRVSFLRDAPPDKIGGPVDADAFNAKIESLVKANPDQADLYRTTGHNVLAHNQKMVSDAAESHIKYIDANGGTRDPSNADDVRWLQKFAPDSLLKLRDEEARRVTRTTRLADRNEKYVSKATLKDLLQQWNKMADESPQALVDFKVSELNGIGLEANDMRTAKVALAHMQKDQQGPDKFNVRQYIKTKIDGELTDPRKRAAAFSEVMTQVYEQGLQGSKTAKEVDAAIENGLKVASKGFFGGQKLQVEVDAENRRKRRAAGTPAPARVTEPVTDVEIEIGPDGKPRIKR